MEFVLQPIENSFQEWLLHSCTTMWNTMRYCSIDPVHQNPSITPIMHIAPTVALALAQTLALTLGGAAAVLEGDFVLEFGRLMPAGALEFNVATSAVLATAEAPPLYPYPELKP